MKSIIATVIGSRNRTTCRTGRCEGASASVNHHSIGWRDNRDGHGEAYRAETSERVRGGGIDATTHLAHRNTHQTPFPIGQNSLLRLLE